MKSTHLITTYTVCATGISDLRATSRTAAIKLGRNMLREAAKQHGATVYVIAHHETADGYRTHDVVMAWAWLGDKFHRVNP